MMGYLGMSYVYEDPRFRNAPSMTEKDREELEKIMLESVREKTLAEWMDIFVNQTANVAAEPYMTSQEAMKHPPGIAQRPGARPVRPPAGSDAPARPPGAHARDPRWPQGTSAGPRPAHRGGPWQPQRREEGGREWLRWPSAQAPPGGRHRAGPGHCHQWPLGCALLTELGARVIRIEAPDGDYSRHSLGGLPIHRTMAGTEGVCLNLKTTEGQEVVHKLAAKADILLHSMRPGAPERTGIGYEQLAKINPRLVYFYAGGYGSTGPHSHRPSMAPIAGAVCGGAMTQIGRDTVPPPDQDLTIEEIQELSWKLGRANDGSNDHNASMVNSVAMLMGLYAREHTGRGQYIESNMLGANGYANVNDFFWHEGKAPRQLPDPEGYGLNALYRLYRARKGWVFLACPFEEEWRALCQATGRQDLFEDPRFATSEAREENDAALAEQLEQVFAAREPLEWEKLLTDADVACVHAEDRGMYWFYNEDPHVRENGFLTEVESARLGKFWRYSPLLSFSHTAGRAGPGP